MELRHLETFRAVVDAGTFLGAARALRYGPSTVTLHVQELEAELGVALFERHGRRTALTDAGRLLYEEAGQVLDRVRGLREAMGELSGGAAGEVRLGAIEPTASLRLPGVLARLCEERPRLALAVEVGGTRSLSTAVAAGELDVAVTTAPPGRLRLHFEPLFAESLVLVVPESHPLARRRRLTAGDLAGARLLLSDAQCAYREAAERLLAGRGVSPYAGIELGSLLALRTAVTSGLGVAVVPACLAEPPPPGTRVRRLPELEAGLPVGLVRRRDAGRPWPALAAVLQALRTGLSRGHPPGSGLSFSVATEKERPDPVQL